MSNATKQPKQPSFRVKFFNPLNLVATRKAVPEVKYWEAERYSAWLLINEYMIENEENMHFLESKSDGQIDYAKLTEYIGIDSYTEQTVCDLVEYCIYKGILVRYENKTINPKIVFFINKNTHIFGIPEKAA